MKISIDITDKNIRELINGAGSRYWAKDFKWNRGLAFTLTEHGDGDDKRHAVTAEMVRRGLEKMARSRHDEGGHHFPAVMGLATDDMWTGDAVIQYAVFGELKYG